MVDYAAWRVLEKEFRDLQRDHPELVAEGDTIHNRWLVRGSAEGASGEDHFAELAELAAQAAGCQSTDALNDWLALVKDYLVARNSKNIECFPLASARGLTALPDILPIARDAPTNRWEQDDPRVKRGEACTIRPVCQASADYCLERAKQCKRAEVNGRLGVATARDSQKLERVHNRVKGSEAAKKPMSAFGSQEADASGLGWQCIEIVFLSDERVQIRNGGEVETRNYSELGFVDRRSEKPNHAWEALRTLAEHNGIVRSGAKGAPWSKVEKQMQEIRKRLRGHFGLSEDPIPFVNGTGYQARFKICCHRSFRT